MSIIQIPIEGTPGNELVTVPMCQFTLNDDQQFACIGITNPDKLSFGDGVEHVEYGLMGKLSEQGFIFESQTINSLKLEGWDFDEYPDPYLVLMTLKEGYTPDGKKIKNI